MSPVSQFDQVSIICKANIYFDGKVVSHTVLWPDGEKKTIGLIYPGEFRFNTGAPERMEIVAGCCRARLAGATEWQVFAAGSAFPIPESSYFDIAVEDGIAEYICSFG